MPTRTFTRDESQERTRQLLLDAASELFERDGYRATSLADVAAAAGFSKGAVYSNFTGKEHLFLATVEVQHADMLRSLEASLLRASDRQERLAILGAWFIESIAGHPNRIRAMAEFALATDANAVVTGRLGELRRMVANVVERLLEEHQRRLGITFRLPPEELAQAVLALFDGFVIQDTFEPTSASRFSAAMELLLATT